MPTYRAKYTEAEKKLFGSTVRRLMNERGINQSELGRLASRQMPGKAEIPRAAISTYVNGTAIPAEERLEAIARVFNLPQSALLPRQHRQAPGEPALPDPTKRHIINRSTLPDGMWQIDIHGRFPRQIAQQLLALADKAVDDMEKAGN